MFSKAAGANQPILLAQATDDYPFGKSFENVNISKNRYLYNGKELQDQTIGGTPFGWYDYGARFYDPEIARWHSPDQLAESYFEHSTFHFSGNNPIKYVDYNGMNYDNYGVDEDGYVKLLERTNDNYDVLYAVDNKGNKKDLSGDGKVSEKDGVKVEEGVERKDRTILPELSESRTNFDGNWTSSKNLNDIGNIFLFASTNTKVEWSMQTYNMAGKEVYALSTSHNTNYVQNVSALPQFNELNLTNSFHSHPGPGGTKGASYAGGVIRGDWDNVKDFYNRWIDAGKNPYEFPKHAVYHKESRTFYYYTPWKKSIKGHTFIKNSKRPYL